MNYENQKAVYTIKTSYFEGPFNLLLSLIEERKLHINDLSLAEVTEGYLEYVKKLEGWNDEEVSNFIVVAATLILIKSKSLLPSIKLSEEEEGEIADLENRLKLFEYYTNLAEEIKHKFGKQIIFTAQEKNNNFLFFLPDSRINMEYMMECIYDVIGRVPQKSLMPEVAVRKVISLEEMMSKLSDKIEQSLKLNFKEFTGAIKTKEEKITVIVGFLAMLELVRQGFLNVMQNNNFEDIIMERINNQVENQTNE